ncbi:MAG: CBS domain-containing protein [Gammaproteobacteria bacterium]|nr:CBS domain-containing protein [Gammaproteobacteria bacterium]TVQ49282.1 MAG: CBS domain-containing protein [Gammaproteobacteria bacterium]
MSDEQPPSTSGSAGRGLWARLARAWSGELQSRDDVLAVLSEAGAKGLLDAGEQAMLLGVLRVSEEQVRDVMVPRSQMVVLDRDAEPADWLRIIIASGHSRFPVIGEDRDEVLGILLAKDLLRMYADGESSNAAALKLMRPAVFIPESKRLNTLLNEFRESHNHMAIVVDEYGGVAGLLTIEDVLEEIVGDIDDEHDPDDDHDIQPDDKGGFIVRAFTRVEDFNAHFAANFSDDECDTIGGLVIQELGRMPRRGDTVELEGLRLRVLRADRRRIDSLHVTRLAADGG